MKFFKLMLYILILCMSSYCFYDFGYTFGSKKITPLQEEILELQKENMEKTIKYNREKDSMRIVYEIIDISNKRINNSINKLLKQNDQKINELHFISDSAKWFIADSLLKRAGYR